MNSPTVHPASEPVAVTAFELAPGATGRQRLDSALDRLVARHGFLLLTTLADLPATGLQVILLTEDPQKAPEVLDAAVILPEALKSAAPGQLDLVRAVASPELSAELARAEGIPRFPAVLFRRAGTTCNSLLGIRDWGEYEREVRQALQALADPDATPAPRHPKPLSIPVRVATPGEPS